MVLDTSAIMAILLAEPSAERLLAAIELDQIRLISAGTVIEVALVLLRRYGDAGESQLDRFLNCARVETVPVDSEQVMLARDAAVRYGRGRSPAALNFGDCFSYALSVARGEPLLFIGDDFSKADVEVCAW